MFKRFPKAATALAAAGVLFAGAAVAASAHQLSGANGSFEDESATAPRMERPEPSETPEVDEATSARIVVVTPTPKPTETPETEDEDEDMDEAPAATRPAPAPAPARESEHEGTRTQTTTSGHDD